MRRKRGLHGVLGLLLGVTVAQLLKSNLELSRGCRRPLRPQHLLAEDPRTNLTIQNSDKTLLFVGVMTAERYLDSRAKAVYETWGSEVPGKLAFFSSEYSYSETLPLVSLPGVDDSYPPQKKSFMMLQYMYEHYGDSYEWFLRADDDVCIRMDRLEGLLRSVDSRKPWFIGQAGRGNSEEIGLLSLDHDENFCMGGPGVILSRETLRRIAPHIKNCLRNLYTTHEDVELGRCVRQYAGIQCTWSYEMQTILYHNQSGGTAFTGELKQKEVHRAISMHPIKQPRHLYRLHSYVKGLTIQALEQDKVGYHREIATALGELGVRQDDLQTHELTAGVPLFPKVRGRLGYLGDPKILGTRPGLTRYQPGRLEDVLDWELIVARALYSPRHFNPRRKVTSSLKEGLEDIIREVMMTINMYSKQLGRIIDYKELIYGYWRYDPLHGADVIVDMLLTYRKYRGHKMTVPVRRHAYLQQTFTGMHIREIDYSDETDCTQTTKPEENKLLYKFHEKISQIGANLKKLPLFKTVDENPSPRDKNIVFIMPLSGRFSTLVRFMKGYEDVCLHNLEKTTLVIVLYRSKSEPEDFTETIEFIDSVNRKYGSEIRVVKMSGEFSRARALQRGTEECSMDDLMFFVDVDIVFNAEALLRIRFNTIRNRQLYFPIVYSQYDPNVVYSEKFNSGGALPALGDFHINERNGFWRQFGFGIVSLYRSDFHRLGGFNTNITGWGYEDVDFYEHVIVNKLKFLRTPDPGLVHIYHNIECNENLDATQKEMCKGTKISILGSTYNLEQYVMKRGDVLESARKIKQNRPG